MGDFVCFVAGVAVGVTGMIVKERFLGSESAQDMVTKQRELDKALSENEKFRNRNKEMERQIEDLLSENRKLNRKFKESDETNDDFEDELDKLKGEIKKLRMQNEELNQKTLDYKDAYEVQTIELENIKNRI